LGSHNGGNDVLDGGPGDDILIGDASSIDGTARGGNDTLLGGDAMTACTAMPIPTSSPSAV